MKHYDVAIIGGGPAGSAAGTLLAQGGKTVAIIERALFPRFQIGESLIPFGNDVLVEMQVWEKLHLSDFMPKKGAEFTLSNSCGFQRFWFKDNLKPLHAQTFQVERAKFDKILLDHAKESGCDLIQPASMESIEWNKAHATLSIRTSAGEEKISASYVIDASGREAWLAKKLSLPKSDLGFSKKMAIYAHFENAYRNDGEAAGHITIVRREEGWFWIIPLACGKTSVGVVLEQEKLKSIGDDLETRFKELIDSSSEVKFRLKKATISGKIRVTTDFTYRYPQNTGDRWLLTGDAAGFVDPIFSSGVMIALRSGRLAARAILAQKNNDALSSSARRHYTREIDKMTTIFIQMIQLFYDNDAFAVFMNPRSFFNLRQAINRLVTGETEMSFDLWSRLKLFQFLAWLQKLGVPVAPRLVFGESRVTSP